MKEQNISDFQVIDQSLFSIKGVASIESDQYQYAQTRFRGYHGEILKLVSYLDGMSYQYKSVPVDDEITELRLCGKITPELVERFPVLKATGLIEDFRKGIVNVWLSESGFSVVTEYERAGFFEGHHDSGIGRWAWERDMMDSFSGAFPGSDDYIEIHYYYPFKNKWSEDNYLLEVDGHFYGKQAKDNHDFIIENGVLVKYAGRGGSVEIPKGVIGLDKLAFNQNKTIKEIIIPGSVKTIPEICFSGCIGLEKATVGEGVEQIARSAFCDCSNLKSISLPSTLQSIGDSCFRNCASLENVELPEGIETIEPFTFCGCSKLERLSLPDSLRAIGQLAFYKCQRLDFLTLNISENLLSADQGTFDSIKNVPLVVYNKGQTSILYYSPLNYAESFSLPETITHIGESAFLNCKRLKSVKLPKGLVSIAKNAFADCNSLEEAELPAAVTDIGNGAFFNCNLKEVVLPKGVHSISEDVFCQNPNLEKVAALGDVESIGDSAFSGCQSLREVILPPAVKDIVSKAFYNCRQLRTTPFGENIETIGFGAFQFCEHISAVSLPHKMSMILDQAFANCSSLKEIRLPDEVDRFGSNVFCNSGITEVRIPKGIKEIPASSFSGCKYLKSVVLEDGIRKIGGKAFSDCPSLTEIRIMGKLKKKAGAKVFENSPSVVVYGIPGSKAEDLARDNNVEFRAIETE